MTPFSYHRARDLAHALELADGCDGARFIAGGTGLLDLMKEGVEKPKALIDLNHIEALGTITRVGERLRLGALVRNSDLARSEHVRQGWPLLAEATLAGASPQLRNMATLGGNLLQRTRCPYFRNTSFACNKREPNSGCSALTGFHRSHAVLGVSEDCIATHPSDLALAMLAYEGEVRVVSQQGSRAIPLAEFHRLPGSTPQLESDLGQGEIIESILIDAPPPKAGSSYEKVRDRASYEFALASAGVLLTVEDDRVTCARLALGGVATKPWRAKPAEAGLLGQAPTRGNFRAAAERAFAEARPGTDNAFKPELGRRTLVRALERALEVVGARGA